METISTGNLISFLILKFCTSTQKKSLVAVYVYPWKQNFSSVKMSQDLGWESERRALTKPTWSCPLVTVLIYPLSVIELLFWYWSVLLLCLFLNCSELDGKKSGVIKGPNNSQQCWCYSFLLHSQWRRRKGTWKQGHMTIRTIQVRKIEPRLAKPEPS